MKKLHLKIVSLLSPVSLTPLINIYSWISPQIFKKNWNGRNGIIRGPGKTDLWKNLKLKSRVRLPLTDRQWEERLKIHQCLGRSYYMNQRARKNKDSVYSVGKGGSGSAGLNTGTKTPVVHTCPDNHLPCRGGAWLVGNQSTIIRV